MKKIFFTIFALALTAITIVSCSEDTKEVVVDSSQPNGVFTVKQTALLMAQNGTPTKGTIEIGTDSKNITFLHLKSDFTTEQGTGTSTLYLSKTGTFTASPGTGNPALKLIGIINKNGEAYYKVNGTISIDLKWVIIWCASANVPFGNGELK